jgi:hypothetical protein
MDWKLELVAIPVSDADRATEVHVFDWGSFVYFSDPDGNRWSVQQLPARG